MNLAETMEAIKANGVEIAFDPSVHAACAIDSNCPKAIDLRRLITEAGITLQQLLNGYVAVEQRAANPVDMRQFLLALPVDGRVDLNIMGQTVRIDLTQRIRDQINSSLRDRFGSIESIDGKIRELGTRLYSTYLAEIANRRNNSVLPQLEFNQRELLETGCMYTKEAQNYIFYFPVEYAPEAIYHDGYRYGISETDKLAIKRNCLVKFTIHDAAIVQTYLWTKEGAKMQHYHGSTYDCWGTVQIPRAWDHTLNQLYRLSISLSRALGTVNYDSPLNRAPRGMPTLEDLFHRATRLGREGVAASPEVRDNDAARAMLNVRRTGWGRGNPVVTDRGDL